MSDFSLVIFTVLTQAGAGAAVTLWLMETLGEKIDIEVGRLATGSIFVVTIAGLLASLLHLGHPLAAPRALTHLGSSWLSREVALFSLFLVLLALYFTQWQEGKTGTRKRIAGLTALVAVTAVIASGMIYVLPARPAWNNLATVLFFLLTSALLGPLFTGLIFTIKSHHLSNLGIPLAVVMGVGVISFLLYISSLLTGNGAAYLTGLNMINSIAFWARLALGWLVPLGLIGTRLWRKEQISGKTIAALFLLVLAGEILGRELFYSSVVALQIAAF